MDKRDKKYDNGEPLIKRMGWFQVNITSWQHYYNDFSDKITSQSRASVYIDILESKATTLLTHTEHETLVLWDIFEKSISNLPSKHMFPFEQIESVTKHLSSSHKLQTPIFLLKEELKEIYALTSFKNVSLKLTNIWDFAGLSWKYREWRTLHIWYVMMNVTRLLKIKSIL